MMWLETITNTSKLYDTICTHLPSAFIFAMLLGNNMLFGYILASDCFCKTNLNETTSDQSASQSLNQLS